MTSDRVSLSEGYEGAVQNNKNLANEGGSAHDLAKKQHANTEALHALNKGSLANQAGNGSTASANSISAGALMHTNNASGGSDYLRRTAGHEDSASHTAAGEARTMENAASDLSSKINRA